jgi:hypothetical protein
MAALIQYAHERGAEVLRLETGDKRLTSPRRAGVQ